MSSEEKELFTIDSSLIPLNADAFVNSDSESESEIPQFKITAFDKYISHSEKSNESLISNSNQVPQRNLSGFPRNVCIENIASNGSILQNSNLKKKTSINKSSTETSEKVSTFLSRRQARKKGLKERDKTKGFQWYNMPAPELTEEKKNDLLVVQMRQALDPKHFYKRSASKTNPKYFEIGTYVESPLDFYSSRIPKKQRKQTLVEELMADVEFRNYQKKKMTQILQSMPKKNRHKKSSKKNKEKKNNVVEKKQKKSKKNK